MQVLELVDFQPFKGILPVLGENECICQRVSPPYDIISPEELKELQSHEYNITNITLGGENGDYSAAAEKLASWISKGIVERDRSECYYLYRQKFKDGDQWLQRNGIIGILKTEDYSEGNVIPHEETFPKVKEDRLNLLKATEAHCESIFGLYDESDVDLECFPTQKLFSYTDDLGTVHEIHRISSRAAVTTLHLMMRHKKILIADGHHRYETAYRYSQEYPDESMKSYVLCTLVSSQDSGMFVRPTHRLVMNLESDESTIMSAINEQFETKDADSPEDALKEMDSIDVPVFGITFPSGKTILAKYNNAPSEDMWSVDTYVCQEIMFKKVLAPLVNGDLELSFDHDPSSAVKKVSDGEAKLAIFVKAPSLQKVWELAMKDLKMPKKTTYFWPKIWSGFVIYKMKEPQ
ncbi:DUF1015 family protein [Candidatus Methanomassiliicoccus intestinalis]|jgi:hypothetical protein|nr:DUF1015 domain-containing protein [Candidatus Methanomassiliicoccus intestinalis]